MTGLSFVAALVGAKTSSTAEDSVAAADVPVTVATPSRENAMPPAQPTAPPRKNAWSIPAAAPAIEKIADVKAILTGTENAASKPAATNATKQQETNDEPSASSAPHSVETAMSTTANRRASQENENQNDKVDSDKKSVWKKPDANVQSRAEDDTSKGKDRSDPQEQKHENQKREGNAGKQKNKKGSTTTTTSSSHDGKQKKFAGNKPKQQKGGAQTANQQQKGKKGKQANSSKGGEKGGNQNGNNGMKSKKKSAKSNNNKKKNNNKGQKQRKNMHPQPPSPLSPAELEQLKVAVVCQVEYFFSDDELCRNTFLRRNMDCEGFVPAALIFNFPSIAAYCFHYYDLLTILSENSSFLEIDQVNETLRRMDDNRKWLHPNAEGGFGCPRWIKHVEDATPNKPKAKITTTESDKIGADAAAADDASSSGSNGTKDTDSCTDSENLEEAGYP
eukprot:CAMPEP_0181058506 /NCGR_PEP_ID=MMETSP1070-20121207/20858_1 /TAXON_ID=265543 /ORGANISM="Minutocellus polymorphus, Strain NH13" /LENGTH=447 /DNA_ID=CAMNT_0023138067 /DNA_START=215 /DNA_END=1558 /DNA_ORIENTATION=+